MSPSVERAWIEINIKYVLKRSLKGVLIMLEQHLRR